MELYQQRSSGGYTHFTHSSTHLILAAASVLFPPLAALYFVYLSSQQAVCHPCRVGWMVAPSSPLRPFNPRNPADPSSYKHTHTHKQLLHSYPSIFCSLATACFRTTTPPPLPQYSQFHLLRDQTTSKTPQMCSLFCLNFKSSALTCTSKHI